MRFAYAASYSRAVPRKVLAPAAASVLVALLYATSAAAQASNPGFDPLQPEKHFDAQRSEQQRGARRPALPNMHNPAASAPDGQISRGNTKTLFTLRDMTISGARAIPAEALAPAYRGYLGRRVSQADLGKITDAITEQYRAAGFHLSRAIVPAQDIKGGRVQIQVIEGSVTDVVVKGDDAGSFGVANMMAPVLAATPSRQDVLERQLLLINGQPGIRVEDTSLEEIGVASGAFRLTVFVKTWHAFASFGIDNQGSTSVGPWQSYATGAFNSYLRPGDSLVVNLSTTPGDPRQLGFGRIGYDAPVGTDGVRLGGSALYSEVRPGDWRKEYSDVTRTESYEIHASVTPIQSQAVSLLLTTAFTYSNVSEADIFGQIYNDHLRVLSLTADYRVKDNFGGNNYLTLTWRQGLDVLGASRLGDDGLSRDNGSGSFATVNLWFARYQDLTNNWSLKVSAAAQYASTELLTSQQFYLGGAAFGRGYGNAEISGDNAMAGAVELRYDGISNLRYMRGYQLYGFVESGVAWNVGYTYSDGLSLASAGGGVRLFLDGDLNIDIGVGVPLSYRSPDNSTRSARLLFSLSNSFRMCPERAQLSCS